MNKYKFVIDGQNGDMFDEVVISGKTAFHATMKLMKKYHTEDIYSMEVLPSDEFKSLMEKHFPKL